MQDNDNLDSRVPNGSVPLESVLRTQELRNRPSRPPDYEKESRALVTLAKALTDSPATVLQVLVDTMLEVFDAGSTGVSLLTKEDGGKRFFWPAIAGKWKPHIGGGTPRDFGPCGDVLDRNGTLLFGNVARRYTYFSPVVPSVEEALLIPFYIAEKAVGTIWAVSHDDHRFDAEDERLMKSLGVFASSAYQILESLDALQFQVTQREKAEHSARDFVETAPIPMHWVGPDGIIIWANPAELDMLQYSREEYVGRHIAEFHADQVVISDILTRLLRGETIKDCEARLRCKDGSIRIVLISSSGLFENGRFIHTRCITRDITEQKLAERASGLLAAIVDSSDDAIVSKTLDGVITSWNRAAERLFGYSAQEAIGQNISLVIPLERRPEEVIIIEQIRQGIKVDHFETVRVHKDGSPLEISLTISPVRDANGRVVGASKVARDITSRKREETERQRFVTLADRCTEFIGMCDMEFRPFYVNEAGLKVVGLGSLEALRKVEVSDFFFPEDRDYIANEFIPRVLRDGSGETEVRFRNFKTGDATWMIYNVFIIKDKLGNPLALGTFSQNIAARKRTEEALRESEAQLRALAEVLESKVAIRTEELERRNAEVLQQSEQLRELSTRLFQSQDEERRRIARDLHDSAGQVIVAVGMHLASIAQLAVEPDIQQAAKESHEMVQQLGKEIRTVSYLLHPPMLDEAGLSYAIGWYTHGLAERSGLNVHLDISEEVGRLPKDMETAIFRIVQESLTNIHRHSGSKTAAIQLTRDSQKVCLRIKDDGAGMSVEKLATVRTQRSGVGITGMRERVRHLKGTMDIQSNAGGTTISVTFPLTTVATAGVPDLTEKQHRAAH